MSTSGGLDLMMDLVVTLLSSSPPPAKYSLDELGEWSMLALGANIGDSLLECCVGGVR